MCLFFMLNFFLCSKWVILYINRWMNAKKNRNNLNYIVLHSDCMQYYLINISRFVPLHIQKWHVFFRKSKNGKHASLRNLISERGTFSVFGFSKKNRPLLIYITAPTFGDKTWFSTEDKFLQLVLTDNCQVFYISIKVFNYILWLYLKKNYLGQKILMKMQKYHALSFFWDCNGNGYILKGRPQNGQTSSYQAS